VKKFGLEDDAFEMAFLWKEIDPIDNWRCGIMTENLSLHPDALKKGT